MPDIHAVLFDYGLVLSGPADPAAWQQFHQILSVKDPAFHTAYWAHRHAYDRGDLDAIAYWRQVAADLNRTIDDAQVAELIATDVTLWTQPNQPMIDWAASLQRKGIKTGILSNIGDAMETGILARFAWLADFTHRTFSHRLRLAKPEAAIYAHAAAGLSETPAYILFLDDREENIAAARTAGMIAIQYTSHKAFLSAMETAGLASLLS